MKYIKNNEKENSVEVYLVVFVVIGISYCNVFFILVFI